MAADDFEGDEFFYHECMTHPAALAHPNPESILVIGGGDAARRRNSSKHPSVKRIVMAELDPVVIDISRKYLGTINKGALDDPRLEIRIGDGYEFVKSTTERFDMIVLDLTDPDTPAFHLYSEEFFRMCQGRLKPGGMLTLHLGSPVYQAETVRKNAANLRKVFSTWHRCRSSSAVRIAVVPRRRKRHRGSPVRDRGHHCPAHDRKEARRPALLPPVDASGALHAAPLRAGSRGGGRRPERRECRTCALHDFRGRARSAGDSEEAPEAGVSRPLFSSLMMSVAPPDHDTAALLPRQRPRCGESVSLPATVAHHALRVLRLRDRAAITLFNGRGGEFEGRLQVAGGTQRLPGSNDSTRSNGSRRCGSH